ncbi:hypothetical protein [Novosphingobium album (ex Hu et al. 2023)]|uniref:Cytochrome c n=1 Tax=Novosphingobium album (ex Hu et al. 2023) TaxID=2930093 RepID=A0ABT0B2V5_9SPHN|nr:hypothetical protein [Novosphingobium album (ex Hu et al. 2023)]MCJ2179251.1 hypothetical protein [Novosphingobium album (ex Hu et al. 2023)]
MRKKQARILASLALTCAIFATACSKKLQEPAPEATKAQPPYVIGLGEIMGLTQMRHAKLWFAGKAENWPLAAYELDELREGFDDAMLYHPHHRNVPYPLTQMVPEFVSSSLDALDKAIKARNRPNFDKAFDSLTAGCNACHREANFGFNVLKRPTAPPYSNQSFAAAVPGPGRAP